MRDAFDSKRPSLREIFGRFVPLRGIFVEDANISTSGKYQMLTSRHTNIYCHFTTNFLLFVIYTPGFSPSSDSPFERTFLPVRS